MADRHVLRRSWSVCPVCLTTVPAERVRIGSEVYLCKTCEQHGDFKTVIWRGCLDFDAWVGEEPLPLQHPRCPGGCGLCRDHLRSTCCVILNVTDRCNLNCRFCFSDRSHNSTDPSISELTRSLEALIDRGKTLIQLSGGEPTVRDDLPAIIRAARTNGARYVQLNTNGIRLSGNRDYVRELAEAGLSFVFMQFDGTDDEVFRQLRGRPLLDIKKQAIETCAGFNIGVTLVPTLVRGINDRQIGDILAFATAHSPAVRGVHFQPVAFFGRIPRTPVDADRITMDELMSEIRIQTGGRIREEHLLPSCCDHPLCGFHGDFVIDRDAMIPLLRRGTSPGRCPDPAAAEKNREFVARRWLRTELQQGGAGECCTDIHDMEYFVKKVRENGFTVTAMAFQDAGNLDVTRLRRCSLHVFDNGRFVPFCSYYLSGWSHENAPRRH